MKKVAFCILFALGLFSTATSQWKRIHSEYDKGGYAFGLKIPGYFDAWTDSLTSCLLGRSGLFITTRFNQNLLSAKYNEEKWRKNKFTVDIKHSIIDNDTLIFVAGNNLIYSSDYGKTIFKIQIEPEAVIKGNNGKIFGYRYDKSTLKLYKKGQNLSSWALIDSVDFGLDSCGNVYLSEPILTDIFIHNDSTYYVILENCEKQVSYFTKDNGNSFIVDTVYIPNYSSQYQGLYQAKDTLILFNSYKTIIGQGDWTSIPKLGTRYSSLSYSGKHWWYIEPWTGISIFESISNPIFINPGVSYNINTIFWRSTTGDGYAIGDGGTSIFRISNWGLK